MYSDKRVLLIAGGGALGTYVGQELLRLGTTVEVICPEPKESDNERLVFHQSLATRQLLEELFAKKHYDGIVNFLHYPDAEDYKAIYPFLIRNTDHLIFLSSYRVYADEQHPITESAPRLTEVVTDKQFLEGERYAVPKSRCEDFLRNEHPGEAWTIVRPVISSAMTRLDLLITSGTKLLSMAEAGKTMLLPKTVRDYRAGVDWAGNSGKLIANLLFKKDALGETFTIYSGHNATWGQVAEIYERLIGLKVSWCEEREFFENRKNWFSEYHRACMWKYDRAYNRDIDCSKVMRVTGLTKADFASLETGIAHELKRLGKL